MRYKNKKGWTILNIAIIVLTLAVISCERRNFEPVNQENEQAELVVKDDYFKQVGYAKVNEARITDIAKFRFSITADEAKTHTAQRFFDIAIVFESAKILRADSPKLRGEKRQGNDKYVLAFKEWDGAKAFSPSAASIDRADLYTSDGKHIDDPMQEHDDPGRYSLDMNKELQEDIRTLKATGMTVLMDIMPDHEDAGWRSFGNQEDARNFAYQINEGINKYNWDGIDIDEEYPKYSHRPYYESTTRVLYELKKIWAQEDHKHPGKKLILGKALFADTYAFAASVSIDGKQVKLADVLDDGWEMSYNGSLAYRLKAYEQTFGMAKDRLGLGVDMINVNSVSDAKRTATYVRDNRYKYMMYYDVRKIDLDKYKEISKVFYDRELLYLE